MKIAVLGAGAMGGSFGGLLAQAGHEVALVDSWAAHVDTVTTNGLALKWPEGEATVTLPAWSPGEAPRGFEVVIVFCHQNDTPWAATQARDLCADTGFVVSFQNGVGHLERLVERLGESRVVGGTTRCSGRMLGPGRVELTHLGETSVGERDGSRSERTERLAAALSVAGVPTEAVDDVVARIWRKWVINCAINPLCAATGLLLDRMIRVPELDALQDKVLDETFAIVRAEGIRLDEGEVRDGIKTAARSKSIKPSMLQHVEAGRATEIDALNGMAVTRGARHDLPTPVNAAIVAIVKGLEERARLAATSTPE